ncbi:MAG: hypothetical protein IJW22_05690 [Clostridia bacterium]|nr:hypothetical protein [Clostridia bacterium]
MKNVFDLKDNERLCALFCQKELDKAQRQRPYDIKDEINAELQFLARLFRKSGFVSFLFGILLVFMSTFVATAHGALWLQITLCAVGILFLGVSLFITVYTLVRQNRFFKSEAYAKLTQQQSEAFLQNLRALGVPDDAFDGMGVMFRAYRTENGKEQSILAEEQYLLTEYYAYGDAERFYLAEEGRVFAFPRAEIVALKRMKREVLLLDLDWGTEEDLCEKGLSCMIAHRTKGVEGNAGYPLSEYFCLQLLHGGETLEILFPGFVQKELYALLDIH